MHCTLASRTRRRWRWWRPSRAAVGRHDHRERRSVEVLEGACSVGDLAGLAKAHQFPHTHRRVLVVHFDKIICVVTGRQGASTKARFARGLVCDDEGVVRISLYRVTGPCVSTAAGRAEWVGWGESMTSRIGVATHASAFDQGALVSVEADVAGGGPRAGGAAGTAVRFEHSRARVPPSRLKEQE